jgi:hypothetical protein
MTTAPVLDPTESRSVGQDAATLRFQRLERVRARQRARRRRRLILVTTLAAVFAGIGVLGFTAFRRASVEPRAHAPTTTPPLAPTRMIRPLLSAPSAIVPATPTVDGVKRDASAPSPPRADTTRGGALAPARDEPRDADPTAAIDWLLNPSRTRGR